MIYIYTYVFAEQHYSYAMSFDMLLITIVLISSNVYARAFNIGTLTHCSSVTVLFRSSLSTIERPGKSICVY